MVFYIIIHQNEIIKPLSMFSFLQFFKPFSKKKVDLPVVNIRKTNFCISHSTVIIQIQNSTFLVIVHIGFHKQIILV